MLEEAVEVMRTLWQGGQRSHHGRHYTVENARVYDLPDGPPPVLLSGFGPKAIRLAARIGDGFVTTKPAKDDIETYRANGGKGPIHAGTKLCFMDSEEEARRTVHRLWPNQALPGELAQVLPTPKHFEQACELVTPDHLPTPMGPDLDAHAQTLQEYADAGVDELFVQQIGPEQDKFFTEWADELLPRFAATTPA
jgi:G6PDH family F420-dependent oxidoreductase